MISINKSPQRYVKDNLSHLLKVNLRRHACCVVLFPSVLQVPDVVSVSLDGDREKDTCVVLRAGVSL